MLTRLARQLLSIQTRSYTQKKKPIKMAGSGGKFIHEEVMRHINPTARINIYSNIYLNIQVTNVYEYPNGDVLIAELHGGSLKKSTASMKINVNNEETQVEVILEKLSDSTDFHCELNVPLRSNIFVQTKDSVKVSNLYSENLSINAHKNITVENIRAEKIDLQSKGGNIKCIGVLQGQNTSIETQQGNVLMDRLLGDKINCKTNEGHIVTNSCYAEQSIFETDTGAMQLKNIHKKSEVIIHKQGELNMTGVHGNINIRSNGGSMNLQLSELIGENRISADKIEEAIINISDEIENSAQIEVTSSAVTLDDKLSHLNKCISQDKKGFTLLKGKSKPSILLVSTTGGVKLGKLEWIDVVSASMKNNR